jgi:hypothetical protein
MGERRMQSRIESEGPAVPYDMRTTRMWRETPQSEALRKDVSGLFFALRISCSSSLKILDTGEIL